MGTDIHGYWEIKTKDGEWIAIRHVQSKRNYEWFSIIGGVRGGTDLWKIPPWNRGIPQNASLAWKDYAGHPQNDLHSTTWLTLKEVHQALEFHLDEITRWKEIEPFDRDSVIPVKIPHESEFVESLIFGWNNKDLDLPWMLEIKKWMFSKDLYECARMVVGFDS
tara:strand:+ start:2809 stop:3300 length:492 start_codon:yes stop_codon:yes gene_type:complete